MPHPRIELLWWEGCPSWKETLEDLEAAVADVGLDSARILLREIDDWSHAEAEHFVGSPTIRVDGRDIKPPGPEEAPSLSCRVYRLRDGRPSPTPDPADLRDALARVAART
jgi:hypothetical protein